MAAGPMPAIKTITTGRDPKVAPQGGFIDAKYINLFQRFKAIPMSWIGLSHVISRRFYFLPCLCLNRSRMEYETYGECTKYTRAQVEDLFRRAGVDIRTWLIEYDEGDVARPHGELLRRLQQSEALEMDNAASLDGTVVIGWAMADDGPGKWKLRFASGRNVDMFNGRYARLAPGTVVPSAAAAAAAPAGPAPPPPPPGSGARPEAKVRSTGVVSGRHSRELPKYWTFWVSEVLSEHLNAEVVPAKQGSSRLYPMEILE